MKQNMGLASNFSIWNLEQRQYLVAKGQLNLKICP